MIKANKTLFSHLEDYCSRRGEAVENAGQGRYVKGVPSEQDFLKHSKCLLSVAFGLRRSLSWWRYQASDYIAALGFEFECDLPLFDQAPDNAGAFVALMSELLPLPVESPPSVRNVVEVGHMGDHEYDGHEAAPLQALFPTTRIMESAEHLDEDSCWRFFLRACLAECSQGESWISETLAEELIALTDLSVQLLPYRAICRSVFDSDPASLFMALYRCVEATYAFATCRKLVDSLDLDPEWYELASALENEMGWHPKEASSLNLILENALPEDLTMVCKALSDDPVGDDLPVMAGRRIYRLRNRIVHHRSVVDPTTADLSVDWEAACIALVRIVFTVFSHAYATD